MNSEFFTYNFCLNGPGPRTGVPRVLLVQILDVFGICVLCVTSSSRLICTLSYYSKNIMVVTENNPTLFSLISSNLHLHRQDNTILFV